jgi:beta-glucosidase/6-phospho-beta-glucosidase/beta-galactosidase
MLTAEPKFNSFVWGGFESGYPKFDDGRRADTLRETKHDEKVVEDYRLLKSLGIKTVRESLGWWLIDKKDTPYNFERYEKMMIAAKQEGIQQIWSLNHFDFPDHLSPYDKNFYSEFARYGVAAAKLIRKYQSGTIYIIPINEISFVTYMCGYVGGWAPYAKGRKNADLLKQRLVGASIAAMNAIWQEVKNVRFIQVDPLFRRIPQEPITLGKLRIYEDYLKVRLDTFDMLVGRHHPELGGSSKHLDIIGCNYYITNQEWIAEDTFEQDTKHKEMLDLDDPKRIPLSELLVELQDRYGRPIIITETGSYGQLRNRWWPLLLREVDEAIAEGIDVQGVCAYPVIDRPEWHDPTHLTNSGLWDFKNGDPQLTRYPYAPTIELLKKYIAKKNSTARSRLLTSQV